MNRQKGIAPILVVILIAVAVGGYLLYQNQTKPVVVPQLVTQPSSSPVANPVSTDSAEIANWKTYTDKNFGYSVDYPDNWQVIAMKDAPAGFVRIQRVSGLGVHGNFETSPDNPNIKPSIMEWINNQKEEYDKCFQDVSKRADCGPVYNLVGETKITGKQFIKTSWSARGELSGNYISYFVQYKDRVYEITLESENTESNNFDDDGSEIATIFQRMLSTFRFTQ